MRELGARFLPTCTVLRLLQLTKQLLIYKDGKISRRGIYYFIAL